MNDDLPPDVGGYTDRRPEPDRAARRRRDWLRQTADQLSLNGRLADEDLEALPKASHPVIAAAGKRVAELKASGDLQAARLAAREALADVDEALPSSWSPPPPPDPVEMAGRVPPMF